MNICVDTERIFAYRGRRKDNGEWVYGGYYWIELGKGRKHYIFSSGASNVYDIEIEPGTADRWTGREDKNDNEVFENDILAVGSGRVPSLVFWDRENSRFSLKNLIRNEIYPFDSRFDKEDIEVVGDAHDNPKLLEVKK